MEIAERIEACINELDERRTKMASFEARVRSLITTLRVPGEHPDALEETLGVLEGVLQKYGEIDLNCRCMIEGLREIGEHLDRIEDGRQKIVEGVERILSHLSQLDEMAKSGLVLGAPEEVRPGAKPKRVLVIRIRPDAAATGAAERTSAGMGVDAFEEEGLDAADSDNTTVH